MERIDLGGGFTITESEWDGYLCWRVTGRLDLYRTPRLVEVVEEACRHGQRRHLIDLCEVGVVDATLVRELVRLHKVLEGTGRLVVTARPGEAPWTLLKVTRADQILEIWDGAGDTRSRVEAVFAGQARGRGERRRSVGR
jgi:anti-anti-sigma regulatory factor